MKQDLAPCLGMPDTGTENSEVLLPGTIPDDSIRPWSLCPRLNSKGIIRRINKRGNLRPSVLYPFNPRMRFLAPRPRREEINDMKWEMRDLKMAPGARSYGRAIHILPFESNNVFGAEPVCETS
jgi:hypothetical protein